MPVTDWTDRRLQRLFQRYRLLYWSRSRRLQRYRISFSELDGVVGLCHQKPPLIEIHLRGHPSDRELRSTVLHEMCHAVAGPKSKGHDSLFFAQLEYLLREGAPITVGFPENPKGGSAVSVPVQFIRCRRLLKPVYERQQRVTTEEMAARFYQMAFENDMTWREALSVVGKDFFFLDIDGRPMPLAEKFLPDLRRAHRRGRADARVYQANRPLLELTPEESDSLNGLSYEEAARRVGVPESVLRSYVRLLNRKRRVVIPPASRADSGSKKWKGPQAS